MLTLIHQRLIFAFVLVNNYSLHRAIKFYEFLWLYKISFQLFFWKKKTYGLGFLLIIRIWTQQIEIFYQDYKTKRKIVSNSKEQKTQSFCQMRFPRENRKFVFIFLITSNGIKYKSAFWKFSSSGNMKKNSNLRRE